LHAVADALFVYVESDIVFDVQWVLLTAVSEPALLGRSRHCTLQEYPSSSQSLYIQTDWSSTGCAGLRVVAGKGRRTCWGPYAMVLTGTPARLRALTTSAGLRRVASYSTSTASSVGATRSFWIP